MRKGGIIVFLAGFVVMLGGCDFVSSHLIRNQAKRKAVYQKFEQRRGDLLHQRQEQLLAVLDKASQQELEALKFLYAYMPLSDLSNYDGAYFLGQVQYALKARESFPWGKSVSVDDFLHFVVPPRTGTENLDTARQVIYHELFERIKGMSMKEAALEVNHWCHEKVVYTSTDDRTSAPLATMKTAFGRCGEESVFTVAALRAVGIPARQIYTPRWAHQDDNHAWVEFWADGQWYFMGACEPEPDVNIAWFTEPARRAMLTATTTPGIYASNRVVNQEENYTRLNTVDNYTEAKDFYVHVTDEQGAPIEGATVRYLVYNYAEFYSLADLKTNQDGFSSLRMGLGDVTVWVNRGDDFAFRKVNVAQTDTLTMTLAKNSRDAYLLELDIVPPVAKAPLPVSEEKRAENNRRLAQEDSIRHAYEKTFMTRELAVAFAKDHQLDVEKFASIILKSRGNWADICAVVEKSDDKTWVLPLLETITEKDLRDAPASVLLSHLKNTPTVPSNADSDIWLKFVLNPRVALEQLTSYKEELRTLLGESLLNQVAQDPLIAERWINENIRLVGENEQYIWVPSVPRGVVEMKAADAYSRDILFVAMCRTAGVPSRIDPVTGKVQYWRNNIWNTVFQVAQADALKPVPGKVSLRYEGSDPCKYSVHFSIARFADGFFKTLTYEYGKDVKDFPTVLEFDPGYYMLVTGNRLNDGSVLAGVSFFNVTAGSSFELPIKLRQESSAIQSLGQVELPAFLNKMDGSKVEVGQLIKTYGALALVWLDPGKEPTRHVLKDLREMKAVFDQSNMPLLFFVPEEKQTVGFKTDDYVLPQNASFANDGGLLKQLAGVFQRKLSAELPVIVLVNAKGEVLYFSSGYKIGTCEQLLKTYQQVIQPAAAATCRVN
ncbi:MAG: transglutaminase domain-containing protein [Breznakibacter sp.]